MNHIFSFDDFYNKGINETHFISGSRVDKPKFHAGDIVRVLFKESHWDRRSTPYISYILDVQKEIGTNDNEYFNYEVKIVTPDRDAPDFYNTKAFQKDSGEIYYTTEENIELFY